MLSAPQPVCGQTRAFQKGPGKLEMRFKSSHPVIRSSAPCAIELEFESTFPDVIEGSLELTFLDDDRVRIRLISTPLVVLPADATTPLHRIELPSLTCLRNPTEFQVARC